MSNVNIPTLQEFIALGRGGFVRADRFVANFSVPKILAGEDVRDFSILCEEAAFPGKTIGTRTLRINALNEQRAHTVDYMGDSITFQFIVDMNWRVRKFFEDWMKGCVGDKENNAITRQVEYYENYISTVQINSLLPRYDGPVASSPPSFLDKLKGKTPRMPNEDQSPEFSTFGMTLYEAWPRAMNVQQVSYSTQQFLRLNVTFTYKYYTTTYTPENVQSIPLATIDPLTQAIRQVGEQVTSAGKGITGLLQSRTVNIPKRRI